MAIPAFQKIRATSQNKTVVSHMRQITSAADQYFWRKGSNLLRFRNWKGHDNDIERLISRHMLPSTLCSGSASFGSVWGDE